KSHTIRAIVGGMMADGVSYIRYPLQSADTISCFNAAKSFGNKITASENLWCVEGRGGELTAPDAAVDMGNSGTGIKFFAGLAALKEFKTTFVGDESLCSRPMQPLLTALKNLGCHTSSNQGKAPLSVQGPYLGGFSEVEGTSSQYLSALLFAAPYGKTRSVFQVPNLNEKPYVGITLKWLDLLQVNYEADLEAGHFEVDGNQKFAPFDLSIPADFSTAAFPLAAAALAGGAEGVKIHNLDFDDVQGDKAVFAYLSKMGAHIEYNNGFCQVFNSRNELHGVEIDMNATPDALPIMAVALAACKGTSRIYNVAQARIKECDRINCMHLELNKL
ncbi:MAG: 3-phosphoshikimate 1-carboxyvinyltransferase, partial [Victivallaceae bacterium]